jgi:hypothetical protein
MRAIGDFMSLSPSRFNAGRLPAIIPPPLDGCPGAAAGKLKSENLAAHRFTKRASENEPTWQISSGILCR